MSRRGSSGASGVTAGLTLDALGALSVVALATTLFLIGLMLAKTAMHAHMAPVMPAVMAGLLASTLVLWRQWARSRRAALTASARLTHLLGHDGATGLTNRIGFVGAVQAAFAAEPKIEIVCVGLSRLDEVMLNLGDTAGQQVLSESARRLRAAFVDGAVIGRIADDAFAVAHVARREDRHTLLSGRLNQLMNVPIETVGGRVVVGSLLGVALEARAADAKDGLRQAQLALAAARAAGASAAVFQPEMDAARTIRLEMEGELRAALAAGGMRMVYQPQIDETGAIIGVEALMRWDNPQRGSIPPAVFVPMAEQCGLGQALGRFALDRAFSDSRRWPGLRVAVNVSPVQLQAEGFAEEAADLLRTHGVAAHDIELEITEGVLLESNPTVLANLEALRRQGFHIALDDFGAGYSGFGYLTQFKIDKIKIDRCFVAPLGGGGPAGPIIRAIAEMSDAVGASVIAEGVETRQQLEALRQQGCKNAQGFYIARPMPADEIDLMLVQPPLAARAA